MEKKILKEVLGALLGEESLSEVRAYGNGHINDTFLVRSKGKQGQEKKQILQKINTAIFQKPEELMENVVQVTAYLEKKIQEEVAEKLRKESNKEEIQKGRHCIFRRFPMENRTMWIRLEAGGVPASWWNVPYVVKRQRHQRIFTKVPELLAIFRKCWRSIRRIPFMRPFRISTIRRYG